MKKHIQPLSWQFSAIKYVLYAVVLIVPLYVSESHLFPYTAPKSLLLIALAIVLAALYVWDKAQEKESTFTLSWGHGALSIFISLLVVAGLTGIVPHHAFFGDMTGMGINLVCAAAIIASVIGYAVQKQRSFIVSLLTSSLLASVLMVLGLYVKTGILSTSSEGSTLGNTSYVGAYLLINVCFALGLFISQKVLWRRVAVALAGVLMMTSPLLLNKDVFTGGVGISDIVSNPLLLSGSANGAVMGIGIAVLAIGALFLARSEKKVVQWIGVVGLVGIFLGIYVTGQVLMDSATSLHQSYTVEKNSNRFLFWDIATQSVAERPLLGYGMNSYSYVFQEHFSPIFFSPGYVPELWTENPHNMFREVEVTTGVLGLMGYLVLLGTTGVLLFISSRSEDKTQKMISIVMFGALLGYVVQNLFVFDTVAPLLMFYVIVGYAIGVSKVRSITIPYAYKTVKVVVACIVVALLAYAYIVTVSKPWKESVAWATYTYKNRIALDPSPQDISLMGYTGDTAALADKMLSFYKKNYDKETASAQETDRYLKTFEMITKNLKEDITRDGYDNFRAHWTAAQAHINIMSIKEKVDDINLSAAQQELEAALAINPNNPLVYYDLIQVYALQQDYAKVLSTTRAAIALAPQYRGGYIIADRLTKAGITNKDFDSYVLEMRDRWCQKDSLCATGKWN